MTTFCTPLSDGRSYMVSSSTDSMMVRRPRAPVLRCIALRAMARSASSRNSSSAPSMSKSRLYCLVNAFFGSWRMDIRASSSSSSRVATTGRRPTNSGMRPNLMRSSGSTSRKRSVPFGRSSLVRTSEVKPMPPFWVRCRITFSRPANAPPTMKRMLEVSTCRNSCWGCLRPPCGGTEATVPSISFSSACCTPSPETSRVMEGLSDLREILSISSM